MDSMFIFNQAFEESRYHRRFHHTIYTLFMTIYIALLGLQISFPAQIVHIRSQTALAITFVIVFLVLIPIYVMYIIVSYHKRIALLNSIIANLRESPDLGIKLTEDRKILLNGLDTLLFAKYKDVLATGKNPILTGKGHWLFLITLAAVVVGNAVLFALVSVTSVVSTCASG